MTASSGDWDGAPLKVMKVPLSNIFNSSHTSTSVKVGQKVAGNELLIK